MVFAALQIGVSKDVMVAANSLNRAGGNVHAD